MTLSTCVSVPTAKSNVVRVLIVGATGFIGHFIAEASLLMGRPTYVLVRPGSANNRSKASTVKTLQDKGAVILHVISLSLSLSL